MRMIKKNMRRLSMPVLLIILSILFASIALTGCGQGTNSGNSGSSAPGSTGLQSDASQMTASPDETRTGSMMTEDAGDSQNGALTANDAADFPNGVPSANDAADSQNGIPSANDAADSQNGIPSANDAADSQNGVPSANDTGDTQANSLTANNPGNTQDGKPNSSQTLSAESGITVFQDSLGREVTVPERPKRVAAMIGSFADIWCLAGGKDSLVAAAHDTWTYFDLGLDESVADIGNTKEPNLEILAASQPDFVIASSNTEADIKILDTLEAMGINVAYFQVSNFEEYLDMLDICTQITGDRERYYQYGELLQDQIDRSKAAADGSAPTVLYVRASASSCKVKNSKGSVLGEMLSDLGSVNIADSGNSLLEDLNMEVIVAEDPQYIFLILQGSDKDAVMETLEKDLLSHPAWQGLTAVQERRFYILDDTLYNLKPNARWGEAYEQLARILYPDSF